MTFVSITDVGAAHLQGSEAALESALAEVIRCVKFGFFEQTPRQIPEWIDQDECSTNKVNK